jgi:hypothetical protein
VAESVEAVIGAYLIITLAATSLAKLRTWRSSSLALLRQTAVPAIAAVIVIIGVSAVEILLATLLMLGADPAVVGSVTGCLFVIFGIYRIIITLRTQSLTCVCAGDVRFDPATPRELTAIVVAVMAQASLAGTWVLLGSTYGSGIQPLGVAAWATPFIVLMIARLSSRIGRIGRAPARESIAGSWAAAAKPRRY